MRVYTSPNLIIIEEDGIEMSYPEILVNSETVKDLMKRLKYMKSIPIETRRSETYYPACPIENMEDAVMLQESILRLYREKTKSDGHCRFSWEPNEICIDHHDKTYVCGQWEFWTDLRPMSFKSLYLQGIYDEISNYNFLKNVRWL